MSPALSVGAMLSQMMTKVCWKLLIDKKVGITMKIKQTAVSSLRCLLSLAMATLCFFPWSVNQSQPESALLY
jgi:hypothetical protein